jgi:ABC-type sugar transport system ATPase subunit
MLFRLVRPVKRKGTINHQFVQRIPADVKARAAGLKLHIPLGDQTVIVKLSSEPDTVRMSLRSREKALVQQPRLVIFDEPTRGVDVGAIVEIHAFINRLADVGMAVVVISSYLPEVLALSDRILVARQGRIVEEMDRRTADEVSIMYAAVH